MDLASQRAVNENVIVILKRFKIIADKYRNRLKRFGLRFNLITGIHNYELPKQGLERGLLSGIFMFFDLCQTHP
jgi:hypothetical protein